MIEDSLGRMVDAGNATLADLRSMLNSLMSSKVTTQPLPKTTETKATDTGKTKEIFELMKQLNQNLSSQFKESKKYLDQVVDLVRQSSTKTTAANDNKAVADINSSLKKMSDTIAALPNGFDKLSSNISTAVSNSLSATQNTGAPNFKNLESMLVSLNSAIKSLGRGSGKNVESEFSKKGVSEIQNLNKFSKAESALRKKSSDKSDKLADAGLKKGSIYTFDQHTFDLLMEMLKLMAVTARSSTQQADLDRKLLEMQDRIVKGKGVTKQSGSSAGYFGSEDTKEALTTFQKIDRSVTSSVKRNLSELSEVVTEIGGKTVMDGILGPGSYYRGLTASLVEIAKHENNIALQSKQIAFQTEGITAANYEQQKQYLVLEETAYRTGVERNKFQEVFLQNQKKGIRNQKDLKEITTAQLFAEKQIGLEAGSLGDDFVKLKQQAGFTNIQINQVAMGMKEAARFSGLTGQELKAAYDSSKGILENMRNASTLTADSVKNITTTMAEAQKLGVDKQVGGLFDAASSSSKLLLSGASGTKTLLFQAASSVGKIGELQNGVLLQTKQGQKALAQGMENVLKRFGVSSAEEIDKLSDSAKMQLNLRLKAAYDMDIGEFKNSLKSIQEGSKGYAERIADINKELKNSALTEEEKLALNAKRTKLENEKYQDSVGFLVKLDETTKKLGTKTKNMDEIFAEFGKDLNLEKNKELQIRINELAEQRNMDVKNLTAKQKTELSLTDAITNINKGLEDVGKSGSKIDPERIQKALAGGPAEIRKLTADIQKGQQELATAEAAKADPQLEVQQAMKEANDKVSLNTAKLVNYMFASLGKYGIMIGLLASIAANAAGGAGSLLESAMDLMPGRKGKGFKGAKAKAMARAPKIAGEGLRERMLRARASRSGGFMSKATKLGSKVVGKGAVGLAKRLPVVGGVIDFGSRLLAGESVGRAGSAAVSGVAGGLGGAAMGAAIGSVIPGLGTAVGALVGGLIGSLGASELGGFIFDIKDKIFGFFGWLGGGIFGLFKDYLWKPVTGFFGWMGTGVFSLFTEYLWKPITGFFDWLGNTALGKVLKNYVWAPISFVFGGVGKYLQNTVSRYWALITWPFTKLYSFFGDWGPAIWKWIKSVAAKIPMIGKWLVGEGGGETEVKTTEPEAVAEAVAEASPAKPSEPTIPSEMTMPTPRPAGPTQMLETAITPVNPSRSYPSLMRPNQFGIAAPSPSVAYPALQTPSAPLMAQPVPSAASPMMPMAQNMQANKVGTSAATGDPNQGFLKNLDKTSQQEISLIEQQLNVLIKIQQSLEIEKGKVAPDTGGRPSRPSGPTSYNRLPTGNFNESSIREVTNL